MCTAARFEVDAAAVTHSRSMSEVSADMRKQMESRLDRLERCDHELDQLENEIVRLRNELESCKGELKAADGRQQKAEKLISELRQQQAARECELAAALDRIRQLEHAASQELEAAKGIIQDRSSELAKQQNLVAQAKVAADEMVAESEAQLDLHRNQAHKIQQQLEKELMQCRQSLGDQISVLEARDLAQREKAINNDKKLQHAKRQEAVLEKKLADAIETISENNKPGRTKNTMRGELKWREEQIKMAAAKEIEAERSEKEATEALVQELKQELQTKGAKAKADQDETNEKIMRLKQELQVENDASSKAVKHAEEVEQQLEKAKTQAVATAEDTDAAMVTLSTEKCGMENELLELKAKHSDLHKLMEQNTNAHAIEMEMLQAKLLDREARLKMAQDMEVRKKRADEGTDQNAEVQRAQWTQKLDDCVRERERESAASGKQRDTLNAVQKQLESEIAHLRNELESCTGELKAADGRQLDQAEQQRAEKVISELRQQHAARECELAAALDRIRQLEHTESQEACNERRMRKLESTISELRKDLASESKRANQVKHAFDEGKEQFQAELQQLRKQLMQGTDQSDAYARQVAQNKQIATTVGALLVLVHCQELWYMYSRAAVCL